MISFVLDTEIFTKPAEQLRIAKACHLDPTSGHMGIKKTVARIRERFAWKGIFKDVNEIVSCKVQVVYHVKFRLRIIHSSRKKINISGEQRNIFPGTMLQEPTLS